MNDAVKRLYQDIILRHSKAPLHEGSLPDATHTGAADNPLCGDAVTVRLRIEEGRIAAARFEARGCALSRAAASIMTEQVRDLSREAALAIGDRFAAFLRASPGAPAPETIGDLAAFAGVREFPSRLTCGLLPWTALARALG